MSPNAEYAGRYLPPFDFQHQREVNHGDGTVTTRISVVAFYRRLTIEYTR